MSIEVHRVIGHNIMSRVSDDGSYHAVALGKIEHPDGSMQEVVEIIERHGQKRSRRVFDLATIVHALLNLRPDEEFELEARGHLDPKEVTDG